MSKLIETCNELVRNSDIVVEENRYGTQLKISKAVLLFTNFAGQPNKFGNTSKNFNIVIAEEFAHQLRENSLGLTVNVHEYGKGTDEEPMIYYINVKVNMTVQYPPEVTLYVKKTNYPTKKTALDDATIGVLDRTDMERADVIINVKESKSRPGWAVFYLNTLKVVQNKISDFDGYYDQFDDPLDPNDEIVAQNRNIIDEND